MPAQTPVTLNDGTADFIFNPDGHDAKFAHVRNYRCDHPDGYAIGAKTLSVSLREMPDGGMRWRAILTVPRVAVETINGVDQPKLLGKPMVQEVNRYFPKDCSEDERIAIGTLFSGVTSEVIDVDLGNLAKMWLHNEQIW